MLAGQGSTASSSFSGAVRCGKMRCNAVQCGAMRCGAAYGRDGEHVRFLFTLGATRALRSLFRRPVNPVSSQTGVLPALPCFTLWRVPNDLLSSDRRRRAKREEVPKKTRRCNEGIWIIEFGRVNETDRRRDQARGQARRTQHGTREKLGTWRSAAAARPRRSNGTTTGRPRHNHGMAAGRPPHSQGTATGQSLHTHGTATARPRHGHGTGMPAHGTRTCPGMRPSGPRRGNPPARVGSAPPPASPGPCGGSRRQPSCRPPAAPAPPCGSASRRGGTGSRPCAWPGRTKDGGGEEAAGSRGVELPFFESAAAEKGRLRQSGVAGGRTGLSAAE